MSSLHPLLPPAAIAVLGLGAMGRRMAARLLDAGHAVTVWNRSDGPAATLAERGATVAATPADAVRGAALVLSMLSDDAASASVWRHGPHAALGAVAPGMVLVESGTVSAGLGPGPRAAPRLGARTCSTPRSPVRDRRPKPGNSCSSSAGSPRCSSAPVRCCWRWARRACPRPNGRGDEAKLLVNGLFATQLAGMAEALGTARALGYEAEALVELLAGLPTTAPAIANAARMMARGDTRPLFTIDLVAKDLGYLLDLPGASEAGVFAATRGRFEAARRAGRGDWNVTGIAVAPEHGGGARIVRDRRRQRSAGTPCASRAMAPSWREFLRRPATMPPRRATPRRRVRALIAAAVLLGALGAASAAVAECPRRLRAFTVDLGEPAGGDRGVAGLARRIGLGVLGEAGIDADLVQAPYPRVRAAAASGEADLALLAAPALRGLDPGGTRIPLLVHDLVLQPGPAPAAGRRLGVLAGFPVPADLLAEGLAAPSAPRCRVAVAGCSRPADWMPC